MASLKDLRRIAEVEFADIVKSTMLIDYKMRVILKDNSFLDVYLSRKLTDKFGFHWECMESARTFSATITFLTEGIKTSLPIHFTFMPAPTMR